MINDSPVPEWWYLGPPAIGFRREVDQQMRGMTPVREIALERLKQWLDACMAAHATPIALIAVGHDEQSGELHVFRTEDGPTDADLGAVIGQAALSLMHTTDGNGHG